MFDEKGIDLLGTGDYMTMVRISNDKKSVVCAAACIALLTGCSDTDSTSDADGASVAGSESSDGTTAAGDESGGDSDETGDETGEEPEPPPPEIGCSAPPSCDKGVLDDHFFVTDEASVEEIAGYTAVEGQLIIRRSDVSCMQFLACLERTEALMIEHNDWLQSLDGLEALREVRAPDDATFKYGVIVSANRLIPDLHGLSSLEAVTGGDLFVFGNESLETLTGFDALTEVRGDVVISGNPNLVDLGGFGALQEIHTYPNPDHKPDLGEPAILGGSLVVIKHPVLERISGFNALVATHAGVVLQYNDVLTDLSGLYQLQAIGGGLIVTHNPELCVSEAYAVGGELLHGPDLSLSKTIGNKDC